MTDITAQQLWFTQPHEVEIREQVLPELNADELLIKTCCSAISTGTEMLVYRGQIPTEMTLDANIETLKQNTNYPLQYGYASVGRVEKIGKNIDASWLGKFVFAFQPHASHFIATSENLIIVPDDIEPEAAVFLANMETVVNLVQDGNAGLGERVIVLGQGVVGLLLSSLLVQFPLADLTAIDGIMSRRTKALEIGVNNAIDAFSETEISQLKDTLFLSQKNTGADLLYEVSGAPQALNLAIDLSGFASRIVVGSWYGNKNSVVAFGGDAHRNRLNITTSQVSSIAPELSGRWDKARRFDVAWNQIRKIRPQQFITHRAAITDANELYKNLHDSPDNILQAVFVYH